jgi:hypothetical protein
MPRASDSTLLQNHQLSGRVVLPAPHLGGLQRSALPMWFDGRCDNVPAYADKQNLCPSPPTLACETHRESPTPCARVILRGTQCLGFTLQAQSDAACNLVPPIGALGQEPDVLHAVYDEIDQGPMCGGVGP